MLYRDDMLCPGLPWSHSCYTSTRELNLCFLWMGDVSNAKSGNGWFFELFSMSLHS